MTGKDDPLTGKDAPVTERDSAAKDGMAHRSSLPALKAMCDGASTRMKWGAALAAVTVLAGMGLLGLSGWFITATAIAGLQPATALAFDVFAPSAGIRLLALGRTVSRYGERLVTHDATLAALAQLRERLFRGWAESTSIQDLLRRPARALFRLTTDLDALDAFYLRLLVPAAAALGATLLATVVVGVMSPWLGLALGSWMLIIGLAVIIVLAAPRHTAGPAHGKAARPGRGPGVGPDGTAHGRPAGRPARHPAPHG